ncbi:MAG: OmpH family outer membrane protein [Bryobacteraceae bacterium]
MKTFAVALGSILLATVASAQTAPTKVGIINVQAAIIGTKEGQIAAKALEEKSAPKKRELEKIQNDISGLRDKLNKMSSVGSEDEKRKLMGEIDQRTKSFNRQVEDAQAELDQEQGRILQELGGRMLTVLDKYSKDNGYAVVLDVSAQNTPVLFAASQVDLTQEVISLYDKNVSPASSAAPAATTPATTKPVAPITRPLAPKPTPVK